MAGLLEHGRGRVVSRPRGLLEVMRAGRQRARPLGERRRGARVRLQAPGLPGAVVDRAADERVAEAVAARELRRHRDPRGQQLVDRGQRIGLAEAGGGRRQVELERLARDRRAPAQPARTLGQPGDLLAERGRHRGRHADRLGLADCAARRARPARELLEVERVAAALLVDHRPRGRAEHRPRLGLAQRPEPQLGHEPVAARRLQRGQQRVRHLPGAERERDQQRRRRRPPQQVGDQLDRRVVGPVDVVEDQHERRRPCELLQQCAHRPVRMEALVLEPAGRRHAARRREHPRELGDAVADQRLEPLLAEPGDVVVERVDPDGERQLALQLGSAPGEHGQPPPGRALGQLAQEPCLADPGLAAEHEPGDPRTS